jgi:MoaA/NifB/PqqE/SkfB family radical SAM enzyme
MFATGISQAIAKLSPALAFSAFVLERRKDLLIANATPAKLRNLAMAGASYALKLDRARYWPIVLKVDLSPVCNLRCTVCVHARPSETSTDELKAQRFDAKQMMTVDQFRRIVDEVKGKTSAMSLYYLGDPFVHPHLEEMCKIAEDAGINTKISSNFSFHFTDERIRSIIESGLTDLTVCVDGLSQDTYSKTRVGGRIDKVIDNLERVLTTRRALGRKTPRVEVQFIKFQHNAHEVETAKKRFLDMGLDQFTDFWGDLNNYTDLMPEKYERLGPVKKERTPTCHWPHFSMTIKYNGDVIPCCTWRQGGQYTDDPSESRAVGNVFETSVWDVWTSKAYDRLRRLVSNPERSSTEPDLQHTFCEGCNLVDRTTLNMHTQPRGNTASWEDMYRMDERGRVVRRAETEVQTPHAHTKKRLRIVEQAPAEGE